MFLYQNYFLKSSYGIIQRYHNSTKGSKHYKEYNIMAQSITKSLKRDKARRKKNQGMVVSGKGIFVVLSTIVKKGNK